MNNVKEKCLEYLDCDLYSIYEIYKLSDKNYIKDLISKSNDIDYFIKMLDSYINYIKNNYLINTDDFIMVINYSLQNKYNEVLIKKSDKDYFYDDFKKLFLYNIVSNIKYYSKHKKFYYISVLNIFLKDKNMNNDYDIECIEKLFINIINSSKEDLTFLFIPYNILNKNELINNEKEIEYILERYYKNKSY